MKKLQYKSNIDIGDQFYETIFKDYGDNYVTEVPFANQLVYFNDCQRYIEEGCYAPRDFLAAIKGCSGMLEMEVLLYLKKECPLVKLYVYDVYEANISCADYNILRIIYKRLSVLPNSQLDFFESDDGFVKH